MESGSPVTTRVELSDGRAVLVAPLYPGDRGRFLTGMQQASPESVYLRFMTPQPQLSDRQVRYLLEIDHRDHEALLAVDEASGEAVGVGRFVRLVDQPEVAEVAMIVIDSWHGLGLGKALGRLLAERARELGIHTFEGRVLAENRAIMAVLESLGEPTVVDRDSGMLVVHVELPETPDAPG
jgi:RimJ/RimL family protein N-acetyltransferase